MKSRLSRNYPNGWRNIASLTMSAVSSTFAHTQHALGDLHEAIPPLDDHISRRDSRSCREKCSLRAHKREGTRPSGSGVRSASLRMSLFEKSRLHSMTSAAGVLSLHAPAAHP